jgi:hypothetical protein
MMRDIWVGYAKKMLTFVGKYNRTVQIIRAQVQK